MLKSKQIQSIYQGTISSYSQVFFSNHKPFAYILLVVSFFDPGAGFAGLTSALITNIMAYQMGFNREEIKNGLYAFNGLLVGLGIGYYFKASIELYIIVFIASVLTLFFVTMIKGVLQKYNLPYLSLPFLFGIWTIIIATHYFEALGLSQRGLYTLNKLYSIGGDWAVQTFEKLSDFPLNTVVRTYFISIGSIFFQFKVIPGIILSLGLLFYSRIAFLLSVYGFSTAYLFYHILGGNIDDLTYSNIGFNYILTAIAVGGFYMIPSRKTFLWLLALIPLVTLVTLSLSQVFAVFHLSIYSLPFNIVVLLFIYSLKFRLYPSKSLNEVYIQQNSPEKNFYFFHNQQKSSNGLTYFRLQLPFYGKWKVMQGHNGEYTHKEEWRHAWDFIIEDKEGKQFKNKGDFPHDYYCYGKSVISPGSGIVEEIVDEVNDNDIGKINTYHNWGNTVIIKHSEYLYSSLNHLKPDSVCVKPGDKVKTGDKIGEVGNSGHSAYPHLHMQFQSTPFIGSKTLDYPIAYYLSHNHSEILLHTFSKPVKEEVIGNPDTCSLLKKHFEFIPGQILTVKNKLNNNIKEEQWEVLVTIDNQTYIYDKVHSSFAFFVFDGKMFQFTHFTGDKSSQLYQFYLCFYRVFTAYYANIKITSELPQNKTFGFPLLFFQDFVAPFFMFLKTSYSMTYREADNELDPKEIKAESQISRSIFGRKHAENLYDIIITKEKIEFSLKTDKNFIDVEIS